jgi:sulfite exporter TauE/SafE
MVDIRMPIGLMFTILGLIISAYGIITVSDTEMYQKSLGININIIMGVIMLIFGLIMLYFARRKKKS